MKKRFKGRNKVGRFILKTIILLGVVGFSFGFFFKIFYAKIDLNLDNETYLNYLVHDALGNYSITDLASLNSTEFLLKYSLGIEKVDNLVAKEEVTNETPLEVEKEEPKDAVDSSLSQEPLVYLFNSHQTEGYKTNFLESFNINNTVLIGNFLFLNLVSKYLLVKFLSPGSKPCFLIHSVFSKSSFLIKFILPNFLVS